MSKVKFVILGPPQGKGRPKFTRRGNFVQTYTPEATASYENLVLLEYHRQCKGFRFEDNVPLDVRIVAYYPIRKNESKKRRALMDKHILRPTKKPDIDNIVKVVLDSLNNVAFGDDSQVVDCQVRKFFSDKPRVVVTIQEAITVES